MCPFGLFHSSRFRKPPSHPGRSDFPSPVGSNNFPRRTFPDNPRLKHSFAYTPWSPGYISSSTSIEVCHHFFLPVQCPDGVLSDARHLPRAASPGKGVTFNRGDVLHHLRRSYPPFIAHTDSCARPKPSRQLRVILYRGSLQIITSPCWEMALPDVISTILT